MKKTKHPTYPSYDCGLRPLKDDIIRSRCSKAFKSRVARMAAFHDKEISDIVRETLLKEVMEFERRMQAVA